MSKELADAKAEIEKIVEFYLPRLTAGRVMTAELFLALEAELTAAVTKGATVGEAYGRKQPCIHDKDTLPVPVPARHTPGESGVLPSVAPKIPSLPRKR